MFEINIEPDLKLREIQMSDSAFIFSIIDKDREYLREWLPFVDDTRMVEDTENFIKSVLAGPADRIETVYVIIYENQPAGLIGYRNTDRANHKTELGYWIAKDLQGKGIVTKACKALINFAFEIFNMNRIQICVSIDNHKSKAIPLRLGFKFEGIQRAGEYLNDHFTNLEIYSMLRSEWAHQSENNETL